METRMKQRRAGILPVSDSVPEPKKIHRRSVGAQRIPPNSTYSGLIRLRKFIFFFCTLSAKNWLWAPFAYSAGGASVLASRFCRDHARPSRPGLSLHRNQRLTPKNSCSFV